MIKRRGSYQIKVRDVPIGGGAPVAVQSMTITDTRDVDATVAQIERLMEHGCDIVRLAVPDKYAGAALKDIRARTDAPLVADIHFDYRLALMAAEAEFRLPPHQPRQHRRTRKRGEGRPRLQGTRHPHPHRRQLRIDSGSLVQEVRRPSRRRRTRGPHGRRRR